MNMKSVRNIIEIDEELCNGCGQCILDCAEGAITLVNGKAKVIADILCDGLGACLGGCPTGALRIVRREAEAYDEKAVERHLAVGGADHGHHEKRAHHGGGHAHEGCGHGAGHGPCKGGGHSHEPCGHGKGHGPCKGGQGHGKGHGKEPKEVFGCPGSKAEGFTPVVALTGCGCPGSKATAFPARGGSLHGAQGGFPAPGNTHWPLKLRLMSPDASFLRGADLLLAADCAAFASPAFHQELRPGKVVLIACPKFEGADALAERLAEIFRVAHPKSCTVARMEVPCCKGLMEACRSALAMSGVNVPLSEVIVTRQGEVVPGAVAMGFPTARTGS